MSTVTVPAVTANGVPPAPYPWPADLLEYARQHNVEHVLEPLLEATRRQFPTAREIRVFLERDVEISDLWFLVYEVHVPIADVPDYYAASCRWNDEWYRIDARPKQVSFVLDLQGECK